MLSVGVAGAAAAVVVAAAAVVADVWLAASSRFRSDLFYRCQAYERCVRRGENQEEPCENVGSIAAACRAP